MSLFLRIFLSFWLAMLLLAGSFVLLQRLHGGEIVEQSQAILLAKAEAASVIWAEGGERALKRWLRINPDNSPLLLVDQEGRMQVMKPISRHLRYWLPRRITPGVEQIKYGHLMLAAELPAVTPKLFLVREIDPGRLLAFPLWIRALMAVIVIGLVSLLLARMLTREVRPLREAAQRMAEGDLDRKSVV